MTTAVIRMRAELVNLDLPHAERIQQAQREYLNVSGATIAECGTAAEAHAAALDGNWQVVGMEDGHGPTLAEAAALAGKTTQTAPVGAGAAPTGETSNPKLADDPDGNTRTQAVGPSIPPAEPGRPTCGCGRDFPKAFGLRVHQRTCFPVTSTLSGLSIAEITAARLAADPASAEVPFEAGGALHVVERCGCNDCEDAFGEISRAREAEYDAALDAAARLADEQAQVERELGLGADDMTEPDEPIGNLHGGNYYRSAVLASARAELLANSTHVGSAGGDR